MGWDPFSMVLIAYLFMVVLMAGLWVLHRIVRNASIADVGFCAGLITVVLWYVTQASGAIERKMLLVLMVCVYAGRLGLYILLNRVIGKQEDARYRWLRGQWGSWEPHAMFGYFQLQAIAIAVFSLPFLVIVQRSEPPFSFWELVGFLIWIAAVSGEAIADRQLALFRADPLNRGHVCREGLWFYSRHPNYFFEWVHWWAYVVMAAGLPLMNWSLTVIAPIGMGWALLKVTGIPLSEQQAIRSRGDEYREYQRTTNAFIPWWPGGRPGKGM
ncbi:MAG TPA: DUF1295 domain-containing protein [Nitrospira sp.]